MSKFWFAISRINLNLKTLLMVVYKAYKYLIFVVYLKYKHYGSSIYKQF